MKRGPKPRPLGNCEECDSLCRLKRNHCDTCYVRKLRNGKLKKLLKKTLPSCFTEQQSNFLCGSLLGDGCIYKHKTTHNPYFTVQRKLKDLEYCKWESNIMGDFVCKFWTGSSYDTRTSKTYEWVKLRTHRSDVFSNHYELWYPEGTKVIPEDLQLTPLSLAVWFSDDGNIRQICNNRLQLKLSTNGFDIHSVELLCALLSERYDAYFGITLAKGTQPIIYSSDNGARSFANEIDSVLPVGMDRKALWRTIPQEKTKSRSSPNLRKTQNGKRIKKTQT